MEPEVKEAPAEKAAEAGKAAPAAPPTVQLPPAEYERLRGIEAKFAESQRATEAAIEKERSEKIKATTDKDELARLLDEEKRAYTKKLNDESKRYADLEGEVFSERKSAAIAQSLAGRQFVSADAAEQVQSILDSKVEVYRDGNGKLTVVDRLTHRNASETLKELLDSPAFAHFLAPTNTTGGAAQQGNRAAAMPQQPTYLESVASEYLQGQSQYPSFGLAPKTR